MDTQIDHAHIGIRTCIENDQNGSGGVPGQWATMRYHEMGLVHSNEHKVCYSCH